MNVGACSGWLVGRAIHRLFRRKRKSRCGRGTRGRVDLLIVWAMLSL